MKAYLQILSTGTADCSPSVVLHFDNHRYLVNCGEGTQRLCMESRFRFAKLKTILFTRTHWDCLGGAPGMLLTLSDVGATDIKLLGAENLTHALISTRPFVYRNATAVEAIEFGDSLNTYSDSNLRITAVQIFPDNYERAEPFEWPVSASRRENSRFSSRHTSRIDHSSSPPKSISGIKRSSDDLQSTADGSEVKDDYGDAMHVRKQILESMFHVSSANGGHPLASKKQKHASQDKPQTAAAPIDNVAAMTDVDIIEAAGAANNKRSNNSHGCGPRPKPHPARMMEPARTSPTAAALCYIFQSPDYIGKFNKQAALDLGVKMGRAFGELVQGKSVPSTTGEMVHPHQVISGARPGRVFMVIDCPSIDYLNSLKNAKEFERFYESGSGTEEGANKLTAACIVHLSGHSIMSHPEYKAWMERFGSETQHIIAHQDYCSQKLIWRSQSASSHRLSKLDPTIFPVPFYNNTPEYDLATDLKDSSAKVAVAESMLSFQLEPSTGWDRGEVISPLRPFLDHEIGREQAKPYMKEYYSLAEQANAEIAKELVDNPSEDFAGKDVVLTALGTGSSHPSKYRNVSATLLDIPGNGTFLLDAGEGTYGQMFRQFGGWKQAADQVNSVDDRIKNLKGIFISHLHADHHLGIVTVIDRWNKLRDPEAHPLYLIAPLKFNNFLQELSDTQDFGYKNVQFIESEDIVCWRNEYEDRKRSIKSTIDGLLESSGFEEISTVDVIHCPWAYGISMTHKDGWKVVYSGDTRPCENLVNAGLGATVLLHEATFEDDKAELAILKKHSTTDEAIMVGEGMEAKFTMLTHFSQRYPKIPQFDSQDKSTKIGICFDLMSVKLGQMGRLAKYLPALQMLYSPQSDEAQESEAEGENSELSSLEQHAE
ncbi:hypothetical protein EDD11_007705 [Mortierella claussenii]|nr:hypothetical protein EDD11_007705 [Mortierella claussenii]